MSWMLDDGWSRRNSRHSSHVIVNVSALSILHQSHTIWFDKTSCHSIPHRQRPRRVRVCIAIQRQSLHIRWYDYITNDEVLRRTGLLAASSIVHKQRGLDCWSRCQTRRWCSIKSDPPDLLQSSRRCPAITWLEACLRSTSHHMDPSDPPGHKNIGDWCSRAGWGQIVLAANHNGGMLWLITSCHDDDDAIQGQSSAADWVIGGSVVIA